MPLPSLTLDDFEFSVPESAIAQLPLAQRDAARLLVRQSSGEIKHRLIKDLITELPPGTLLIFNDSRVIASRLFGQLKTGGKVELFLLAPVLANSGDGQVCWRALGRPMRKLNIGTNVGLGDGVTAEIITKETNADGSAFVTLRFQGPGVATGAALEDWLDLHGYVPLPPYIHRAQAVPAVASTDRERYQTVYARERGSVAAPTAGLHFSEDIIASLKRQHVTMASVCLHVGAGTFLPVKCQDLRRHQMHSERYLVPRATLEAIKMAQGESRPIVVVGTTSLRSLEALELEAKRLGLTQESLTDRWLATDLFIYPQHQTDRYKPWAATGIITNFHQPKSTLFMLICALLGLNEAQRLYSIALDQDYRFFSYGDACLFWLS